MSSRTAWDAQKVSALKIKKEDEEERRRAAAAVAGKDNTSNVLLGYQECLTFNLLTLPYDTIIYHVHDHEYVTEFKERETNECTISKKI